MDTPGARLKETVTDGKKPGVIKRQRDRILMGLCHAEKWSVAGRGSASCAAWMEVDVFEPRGALPVLRCDLEDHVVLVQLGVNDRDFRLAEGAV